MKPIVILLLGCVPVLGQQAVSFSTPKDEYAPTLTADGRRIYYTVDLPGGLGGLDIWYVDRDDTTWGDPINVGAPLNTPRLERACCISADGRTMVLTMCDQPEGFGDCDLYISYLQPDGTWSKPGNLGSAVNSSAWESFPSISRDGRVIYFASDRSGGSGGVDLYFTVRGSGNDWSEPQNLAVLNTAGNDVTPYVSLDDSALYFASDGASDEHSDLDLFMSRRMNGVWSSPIPLKPANTFHQELFPSMSGGQRVLYFCSNQGGRKRGFDIFSMTLSEEYRPHHAYSVLAGKVTDRENNLPLGANVKVTADESDSVIAEGETNPLTGQFSYIVPRGHLYRVLASTRDCYQSQNDVPIDTNADERVDCRLALERLQIGKAHVAERVFQEGTDLFTREGQAEVRKLNTLFKHDPTLRAALFINNEDGATDDRLLRQLRIERLQANLRRVNRNLTNIDWKPSPFQAETLESKSNYIILVPILN